MDVEKLKAGQAEIDRRIDELAASKREQLQLKDGNDSRYYPVKDGVWSPEKYANADRRILFIQREPNDEDGGWRYGTQAPSNDYFFGSMNTVAKGILTGDSTPDTGEKLDENSALYQTAYTNISNLPGGGSVGVQGSMNDLYKKNAPILEKKLEVYDADIIVTSDGDLIWPSIEKAYGGIKSYETTRVDKDGNILSDPNDKAAAEVYRITTNNGRVITVVWTYHPSYIKRGGITQVSWVNGIVTGVKSDKRSSPTVYQNFSESHHGPVDTPVNKRTTVSGTPKGITGPSGPIPIKPILVGGIIILIILLVLFLLRQCKPRETVEPPPPPVKIEPPVPIFQETDRAIFVKDVAELLSDADSWLDSVAEEIRQELEQSPEKTFTVIGYAAIFPGLPDPVELSQERAERVKKELVKRNIPVGKLEAVAGGETSDFGLSREENRRIKILVK
jgi:hypothetical protein